jgi:hypothetical protein
MIYYIINCICGFSLRGKSRSFHSPNLLDHLIRHFFICCNEKYPTPTGRRLPHTTLIYNVIKTKQIVLTKWTTRRLSQFSGQTKYFVMHRLLFSCLRRQASNNSASADTNRSMPPLLYSIQKQ